MDVKQPASSRRRWLAALGAGAAAAAALRPGAPGAPAPVLAPPAPPAEPTGGYALTEHVKRYYQTARV